MLLKKLDADQLTTSVYENRREIGLAVAKAVATARNHKYAVMFLDKGSAEHIL